MCFNSMQIILKMIVYASLFAAVLSLLSLRIVSSTRKGWETLICLIACAIEVYAIRVDYVKRLKMYLHVINGEVLSDFFFVAYSQILDSKIVSK
jgi:hypothetical protein